MTSGPVSIRLAVPSDAAAMAGIYNVEVENHTSTFDLRPRSIDDQRAWIAQRSGAFSAVVAELDAPEPADTPSTDGDGGDGNDRGDGSDGGHGGDPVVVGFASLSPYKDRAAYSTTVENSVYVSRQHGGKGIGRQLMQHIIELARDSGFHSIIARVEVSGDASRALHEACGFRLVGIEREVGRKFGRWLSVAVYQLEL